MNKQAVSYIVGIMLMIPVVIGAFAVINQITMKEVENFFGTPRPLVEIWGAQDCDSIYLKHMGGNAVKSYDAIANGTIVYSGKNWVIGETISIPLNEPIDIFVIDELGRNIFMGHFSPYSIENDGNSDNDDEDFILWLLGVHNGIENEFTENFVKGWDMHDLGGNWSNLTLLAELLSIAINESFYVNQSLLVLETFNLSGSYEPIRIEFRNYLQDINTSLVWLILYIHERFNGEPGELEFSTYRFYRDEASEHWENVEEMIE